MKGKPFAITLDVGSSLANHTGAWRTERPVYVDRLAPCAHACPAGEAVQAWLYRAEEGDYEGAWRDLVASNPLPAVMGRVCFRPCEVACNRAGLDEAVGINAVERFLGDYAIERGFELPEPVAGPSGRRVLVVGSGPAGLAAAYHLSRLGHDVEIRDSAARPGGMLTYGIPAYRLPRWVVDAEIERLVATGITLATSAPVGKLGETMAECGFDAAVVAVGAQRGRRPEIPAGDAARLVDAVSLLHGLAQGERPLLGRVVAVYGGGDTAIDAARTARRLGATDAVVVYRRTRQQMPAHDVEIAEAVEEGVTIRWLSTVAKAEANELQIERMELGEDGFPYPTGERESLAADTLVLAVGQDADLSLLADCPDVVTDAGVISVDGDGATSWPKVFACGDVTSGARTVTEAIGEGHRVAEAVDAMFVGRTSERLPPPGVATAERLNVWYYADAPRMLRAHLQAARRRSTFDEVVTGLSRDEALFEARRCLSCGNCFECDNCFGVCPDNAVIKLGAGLRYRIDLDFCKGCGLCAEECPCGAIDMVPELR